MFKRCSKSGRIVGIRFEQWIAKILFPVVGLVAIAWWLLRVIPKPGRAEYPCQKLAAGLGGTFLAYFGVMAAVASGWRMLRQRVSAALAIAAAVVLGGVVYTQTAQSDAQVLTPAEGMNKPVGMGKGIFPGRVVWEQDFAATKWDGASGNWWEDRNVDQAVVDRMVSKSLQALTGTSSDKAAWQKLFAKGYRRGEKVLVKLNCNPDNGKAWVNKGYPSPQAVNALVRQLVENAGVPGDSIVLSDPSRVIGDNTYNKVRANAGRDYRQVVFEGQTGPDAPQRVKPVPDMQSPIVFENADGKKQTMYLPESFRTATYMINYAVVRPHSMFGITLSAKNHFGSVYDPELKSFKPTALHAFASTKSGPHCNVALLGHPLTGGKTILYLADGLYTALVQGGDVVRWKTLDGRWFSSLLMSQDPVALDSVAYDLIVSEPNLTTGNASFNGTVDRYLHEAALKGLGVHEHWNGAAEKKYSRNLGSKQGIELVALR